VRVESNASRTEQHERGTDSILGRHENKAVVLALLGVDVPAPAAESLIPGDRIDLHTEHATVASGLRAALRCPSRIALVALPKSLRHQSLKLRATPWNLSDFEHGHLLNRSSFVAIRQLRFRVGRSVTGAASEGCGREDCLIVLATLRARLTGEVSAVCIVAVSRGIIKVTIPRLSQEGLGSTEANSPKLNPATV
jgi:hypothetical protein